MKRILSFFLCLLLTLSLCACGAKETTTPDTAASQDTSSSTQKDETNESVENDVSKNQAKLDELNAQAAMLTADDVAPFFDIYALSCDFDNLYVACLVIDRDYEYGCYEKFSAQDYLDHLSIVNGNIVFDDWAPDETYNLAKDKYLSAVEKLKQGNLSAGYIELTQAKETNVDSHIMDYVDRMLAAFTLDSSSTPIDFDICLGVLGRSVETPLYLESVSVPNTGLLSIGDTLTGTLIIHSDLPIDTNGFNDVHIYEGLLDTFLHSSMVDGSLVLTYSLEALPSMAGNHECVVDTVSIVDQWGNTLKITLLEVGFPDTIIIQ